MQQNPTQRTSEVNLNRVRSSVNGLVNPRAHWIKLMFHQFWFTSFAQFYAFENDLEGAF